jgi:hypothetical protein
VDLCHRFSLRGAQLCRAQEHCLLGCFQCGTNDRFLWGFCTKPENTYAVSNYLVYQSDNFTFTGSVYRKSENITWPSDWDLLSLSNGPDRVVCRTVTNLVSETLFFLEQWSSKIEGEYYCLIYYFGYNLFILDVDYRINNNSTI